MAAVLEMSSSMSESRKSVLITSVTCLDCQTRMGEQSGLLATCEWCGTELTSDVMARLVSALQKQF
jgi:hypothetical protein